MTVVVQCRSRVSDEEMQHRESTAIGPDDMVVRLDGDCDVYLPSGRVLVSLRKRAMPEKECERAYEHLYHLRKYTTDNRSGYAGGTDTGGGRGGVGKGKGGKVVLQQNGRVSRQTFTTGADGRRFFVASAIVGYFDRQGGRFPFCRQTAFTASEVERWKDVVPLAGAANDLYRKAWPAYWASSTEQAKRVKRDWLIGDTPFSTLTVNNNVSGNVHKDKGDCKAGLGLISYHCRGEHEGGELVFPQYKIAVAVGDRDLLFFNPHEWHAVNPIVQKDPKNPGTRISVVYYLREKMLDCGTAKEELARARQRGAL